jgi:hypothetical protein
MTRRVAIAGIQGEDTVIESIFILMLLRKTPVSRPVDKVGWLREPALRE